MSRARKLLYLIIMLIIYTFMRPLIGWALILAAIIQLGLIMTNQKTAH